MDLGLNSKVALITGSTSGLGFHISKTLNDEGCTVILNGRDADRLSNSLSRFKTRADSFLGDITLAEDRNKLIQYIKKKYQRLDILVCNVGLSKSVAPGDESEEEWHRIFTQNFFSATNMVEGCKELLSVNGGTIVCISSICGSEVLGAPVTYSCAKAALNHYVRGISRPLAQKNIRINAVCPGNLMFENSVWEQKQTQNPAAVREMLDREVSLKRFGTPNEISKVVAFLSSPASAFCNGSIFIADGGQLRG